MIYTCNQKGNIGYSSSKVSSISKKLFTPIQLSPPILSETIHDKENSLPNTPIQIKRKKKLKDKDLFKDNQNHSSKELQIFNENFDDLVNTIKNNRRNNTINPNITIEKDKLIRSQTQLENDKEKKEKRIKKLKFQKLKTSSIPINNNLIFKKTLEKNLQDEAKSMTNTIEIANFYEYTKNCMRIIVELRENKNKASFPNKVKILNPNNKKKLAVFDLDETLIHGVVNISNYKKEENIISITLPSQKIAKIGVNIRPNWKESIERVSKLYTIAIYTASHKSYADAVLNFLDPENKYFYNRLYRSNCICCKIDGKDLYVKDMNIFEDFNIKDILIVDNSVMAFAYDLDNGIPILPYYNAEKDFELLFVAYYFESLYNCDDLRVINKQYMKLDYFLKQAIEEIKKENEEDEYNNNIENDVKKKEIINNLNVGKNQEKDKDKVISAQNLIMVKKQKEKKKAGKRESKFIEEFQIDLKKLRMKFSSEN